VYSLKSFKNSYRKVKKFYLCSDEEALRHRRDVFREIHAAKHLPASVAAAAAAAVAAAAAAVIRKSAEYFAFASASESPAVRGCGDGADADADRVSASNTLTSSARREVHKEGSAPSLQPTIKRISRLRIIAPMRQQSIISCHRTNFFSPLFDIMRRK